MTQRISDTIQKILLTSRHAPSSHNTQPWKVVVDGSVVILGYDDRRQLIVGDPDKRELFISLGCFVESFVGAAEALGHSVTFTFVGKDSANIARLEVKKQSVTAQYTDKLIRSRRSDRRFYEERQLEATSLNSLKELAEGRARLMLLTDQSDIKFLADQTYQATYDTMSNPAFRAELASWIRNNWTKQPDGMPAYTQGIPGPISLLAKFIIKKNKAVAKDQAKKDSQRVAHSATIGLVCINRHTPAAWLDAGRLYQRACLTALEYEIKTSGVSAAVIDPRTTKQIIDKLRVEGEPVALIRFGYTKNSPKASPRLTLSHFVISN